IAPDGETVYVYDQIGNRQQVIYPNGTYTRYAYDKLNRLTSLETRKPDNSLLASYQYTLLPTGHRSQIVEHTGRVINYSYDDLYRLSEEKISTTDNDVVFSYQYDAVGNRVYSIEDGVHTKYAYDTNDRLLKQGGVEYKYDDNGNTRSITEEDQVVQMSYDFDDRLINVVTEENGQITSTVTYAYDADGNRVQTIVDGELTQYVVDSNDSLSQVIAELDKDEQVKVAYLHGDDLISQYHGNDIHYYHYDGLGSTRGLTDQNAVVTDAYNYDAFGELLEQSGNTENNYLYTGEQIDPNTGNYYLRARYYNPVSGRFLSMDSFDGIPQDPITLHKYLYANADPVNLVDPSGQFGLMEFGAADSIRNMLMDMQIEVGLNFFNAATNPGEALSAREEGSIVLLTMVGGQLAPNLLRLLSGCNINLKEENSFTANTLVYTQLGLIPIEKVEIGYLVLSFQEKSGQNQWNEVTHLLQGEQEYKLVNLTLENGETLETTEEHPFYIKDKGWNLAKSLEVGQALQLHNDKTIVIQEIFTQVRLERVYNLTIANTHNYFVGQDGVLVHNAKRKKCQGVTSITEHFRQWEEYGKGGVKRLQNGRYRYYGEIEPPKNPGTMAGRRTVREWDPVTGRKRTWHEIVDHDGRVRQVRPQRSDNAKVHYKFDENGRYIGKW
ncbi:MAG: RHS repeat-associated core domain-containing protein, partial [Candidatus Parabeggiatoa sp.]|nr:RHS repeat-associated core domain-containing protein [Candidatus Parabeggiatoa sp.]